MPAQFACEAATVAPVSAPPFPHLAPGHMVLALVPLSDVFHSEVIIISRAGNGRVTAPLDRKYIIEVVGFDPMLGALSDEQRRAINLGKYLK